MAKVVFVLPDQAPPTLTDTVLERRYELRVVKHRLHQGSFREAVNAAYRRRCALIPRISSPTGKTGSSLQNLPCRV
jgi:hypothetical protein